MHSVLFRGSEPATSRGRRSCGASDTGQPFRSPLMGPDWRRQERNYPASSAADKVGRGCLHTRAPPPPKVEGRRGSAVYRPLRPSDKHKNATRLGLAPPPAPPSLASPHLMDRTRPGGVTGSLPPDVARRPLCEHVRCGVRSAQLNWVSLAPSTAKIRTVFLTAQRRLPRGYSDLTPCDPRLHT